MVLVPILLLCVLNYMIYLAVAKASAHHNSLTGGSSHRRDATMATLLTGIVLTFLLCHSIKAGINIYEARKVGRLLN